MKRSIAWLRFRITFALQIALMVAVPAVPSMAMEKIHVGKFASRALWLPAAQVGQVSVKRPAIVLIPGSGANGPEEMIPGSFTEDGNDHGLFLQMAESFSSAGWNVLCLGKPGVEFFAEFNIDHWFYDRSLYQNSTWQDLVVNLGEGVDFLRARPEVDPAQIYVLGHSEGTRVAVDYATKDPNVKGLLLLGYSGEDIKTTLEWQFYKRPIEYLIAPDVDGNHDQEISREELSRWAIGSGDALEGATIDFGDKDKLSFAEIETQLRSSPVLKQTYDKIKNSNLYSGGQFDIGPIYQKTASLTMPVYIFTGVLDLQTQPKEAIAAESFCRQVGKSDCYVNLVQGLGHGFSPPRGPRRHPLADLTVGPVAPTFLDTLAQLAAGLGGR